MPKSQSTFTLASTLIFMTSGLAFVAAFGSLLLVEKFSPIPFNLFYVGTLFFCLACTLEFRNIIKFLGRTYYWISFRQIIRITTTLFIAFLLMILSYKRHQLYDWTAHQFYSLNDQNVQFLKQHSFQLTVIANRVENRKFFETMERFTNSIKSQTPSTKIDWIDPIQQPSAIDKLKIKTIPCLIVHEGPPHNNRVILTKSRLMPRDFTKENRLRFLGEPALMQALVQLKNPSRIHLAFLSQSISFADKRDTSILDESPNGHAALKDILEQDGFEVLSSAEIKKTSEPMIIFLPSSPLNEQVTKGIERRITENMPTALLLESQPLNPIPKTFQKYGIKFLRYPVVDHMRKYKNDLSLIAPFYEDHQMTAGLSSRSEPVILQGASAFDITSGSKLLNSSRVSWLETDLRKLENPQFNLGQDQKGPLSIMIEQPKHIFWVADQDFINNRYLGLPGNRNFTLHLAHYLSGQLSLINQRGKTLEARHLNSVQQVNRQFIVLVFLVLPSLCFVIAISLVWLKSRR